ncbi:YceI family protein [Sutcliffiella deserti]|uniref:YceI family protein n=1 Tax=Sutcliffiella deserti TaxID=2875501 RepID=UPI001CBA92BD|nr:YceI family protein [Sutcliffiella deserti]
MTKTNWNVDKAHSTVDFSVKHMMFATVKGGFNEYDATIVADPTDLTTASIEFTVDVASIDTRSSDRDAHLRSADFFDVDNHPKMTFKSTNIEKTDENEYNVTGDLTVRGTTKPETFSVTFEGTGLDPWGNEKAGFAVEGKIKRSDFGLTWNAPLEAGGVLVGDQIKIELQLQAAKG